VSATIGLAIGFATSAVGCPFSSTHDASLTPLMLKKSKPLCTSNSFALQFLHNMHTPEKELPRLWMLKPTHSEFCLHFSPQLAKV
jgi:hypothetical protein